MPPQSSSHPSHPDSAAQMAGLVQVTVSNSCPRPPKVVLVTGGAGFIGSHVARKLLSRGDSVVIVDELNDYYDPTLKRQNIQSLQSEFGKQRCRFVKADICDDVAMAKIFASERPPTLVVHLAARAGVRPSIVDPLLYIQSNVVGTTKLLELARQHKVEHFVYASSSSVYGGSKEVVFRESDDVSFPVSQYAATKKMCELLAHTYHHLYKLNVMGFRFFTVYGPSGRPDMAAYKFIDCVMSGRAIDRYGDGTTERDWTYVSDIVNGVVRGLDRPMGCEVFNLGNGNPIRLDRFISEVERQTGRKAKINVMPEQPGDVPRTAADVTKARTLLGYNPQVSLEEGLRRTVKWYRSSRFPLNQVFRPLAPMPLSPGNKRKLVTVWKASKVSTKKRRSLPPPEKKDTNLLLTSEESSSEEVKTPSEDIEEMSLSENEKPFRIMVGTRIHRDQRHRVGDNSDVSKLESLVCNVASFSRYQDINIDRIAVAVRISGEFGADLLTQVRQVADQYNSSSPVVPLIVVPVYDWHHFTPALNALIREASRTNTPTIDAILFQSLEVTATPKAVRSLKNELQDTNTLVAGIDMGHDFNVGKQSLSVENVGVAIPWNTCSLWNLKALARTGFSLASDGVGLGDGVAGIEEACCIAMHQKLYGDTKARVVLLRVKEGIDWKFRKTKSHSYKMKSKNRRAAKQLRALGLDPCSIVVEHKRVF
eukprot:g109.t1